MATTLSSLEKSEQAEIVKSILPFLGGTGWDSRKAEYLAYRFTGFALREALPHVVGLVEHTVKAWRKTDPHFKKLEDDASGPNRRFIRSEILKLRWIRNFHLFMQHDNRLLLKMQGMVKNDYGHLVHDSTAALSKFEQDYLLKARGNYSPNMLEVMERFLAPDEGETAEDSDSNMIIRMIRRTEEIEVSVAKPPITQTQNIQLEEVSSFEEKPA